MKKQTFYSIWITSGLIWILMLTGCLIPAAGGSQPNAPGAAQTSPTETLINVFNITPAPPAGNETVNENPTSTVVPATATAGTGVENPTSVQTKAPINLNFYCSKQYGSGAYAVAADMKDAYSWSCYQGNQSVGIIDMNQACAWEYATLPNAVMGNRQDAYSWYCSNVNN